MKSNIHLKLDGIEGESGDLKGTIDILSWSLGADNPANSATGGGGGLGKVNISELNVQMLPDQASSALFQKCCDGMPIKNAELTQHKQGAGDEPLLFLKIKMTNATVSSINWSGSSEYPTQSVSLNFKTITFEYTKQEDTGSGGASAEFGWDVAANKKL